MEFIKWLDDKQMKRYAKMRNKKARYIENYNEKIGSDEEKMPYLILIIDEAAELVFYAKTEFEVSLIRLIQHSRALSIYVIIETQRREYQVATGLIRQNTTGHIVSNCLNEYESRLIFNNLVQKIFLKVRYSFVMNPMAPLDMLVAHMFAKKK